MEWKIPINSIPGGLVGVNRGAEARHKRWLLLPVEVRAVTQAGEDESWRDEEQWEEKVVHKVSTVLSSCLLP